MDSFFYDEYRPGIVLGQGVSGTVRECTHKKTLGHFAVKIVKKSNLYTPEKKKQAQKEIDLLRSINHRNVIKLLDIFDEKYDLFIVMELADADLLKSITKDHLSYSEEDVRICVKTTIKALKYCLEAGVIHRDVKPQNVLLKRKTPEELAKKEKERENRRRNSSKKIKAKTKNRLRLSDYTIKLADFGFSRELESEDQFSLMETYVGTVLFMAPEMCSRQPYDFRVDVWSTGVMTYLLLAGGDRVPFNVNRNLSNAKDKSLWKKDYKQQVVENDFEFKPASRWKNITEDAKDFIRLMLIKDPKCRPVYEEVLDHTWLQGKVKNKFKFTTGKFGVEDEDEAEEQEPSEIKLSSELVELMSRTSVQERVTGFGDPNI